MRYGCLRYFYSLLLLTVIFSAPAAALDTIPDKPQTASVSFGAEYASGKYGTGTATRSLYMPLIAAWSPSDRFDMGVEIPFLYQSNSNVTTGLFGNRQQGAVAAKTAAKGGPGGARGTPLQGGAGGTDGSMASGSAKSDVSGLGDIIFRLGFIALFEENGFPQVRPSLFVKFPTASRSDGLGTGEFDAGAGVEVTKWFGDLHLTGEALYTWQGRTEGFGLKNYWSYSFGAGYRLTENIEPMVIVKGAAAPSDYSSELLELRARLIWSLTGSTALDLYLSSGIADSSPDYGGGIALVYSF